MPWVYTPELAYTLEAIRVTKEMRAQGVDLDHDQAHALARANLGPPRKWVAEEPKLTPKGRQILEEIMAEREQGLPVATPWPRPATAPDPGTTDRRQILGLPEPGAVDQGQGGTAGRAHQRGADRNKKKTPMEKILAESRDEDDDWEPT
jgi:hypothetical protein